MNNILLYPEKLIKLGLTIDELSCWQEVLHTDILLSHNEPIELSCVETMEYYLTRAKVLQKVEVSIVINSEKDA